MLITSEDPAEPKDDPGYEWGCPCEVYKNCPVSREVPNLVSRLFVLPFIPHSHPHLLYQLFPSLGLSLAKRIVLIHNSGP